MLRAMAMAVRAARNAEGNTFPNPLVGAVLVRDGNVIGVGAHLRAGECHAEINAIRGANDARGATLYVTLEPCAHEGRQPPCVLEIIRSRISRVVVGALDPNPITGGRGVEMLRDAGIEVSVLNDPAALALIRDFRIWINGNRPYVSLKMASSIDGYVASNQGERLCLTGAAWKKYVHQLRYTHQAVLVGSGTVLVDDPHLTIDRRKRSVPFRRVIVAGRAPINPMAKIFGPEKGYLPTVVLFPESEKHSSWIASLAKVGEVLPCPDKDGRLSLAEALRLLRSSFGIVSVLCEGGPLLAKTLLFEDLVETIFWAQAPRLLSSPRSVATIFPDSGDLSYLKFGLSGVKRLKGDVASEYWRCRSERV